MQVSKLKNSVTTGPPLFLSSSIEILDKISRDILLWCVLTAVIPTDLVQSNRGHDSVRVRNLVCQGRVVSRICEGVGVCLLAQYQNSYGGRSHIVSGTSM